LRALYLPSRSHVPLKTKMLTGLGRENLWGFALLICFCLLVSQASAKRDLHRTSIRARFLSLGPVVTSPEWGSKVGEPIAHEKPLSSAAEARIEPERLSEKGSSEQVAEKEKENENEIKADSKHGKEEKDEKDRKEEKEEKDGEVEEESASLPIVALLLMGVIGGTTMFAMMYTKAPHVASRTILTVDVVIAIFLAVLWFEGMDDMLEAAVPLHHHWAVVLVHTIMVLGLAFAVAWALKSKTSAIAIFCGAGAHYCAFTGRSLAMELQHAHFTSAPLVCTLGVLALVAALGLFGLALFMLKRACGIQPGEESENEAHNTFMDRFDDVENDFAAMSLATYVVILIQFWILQKYPEEAEIEPGDGIRHSRFERLAMLFTSLGALALAALAVPKLERRVGHGYIKGRLLGIYSSFTCILTVLAFLLFGQMHVYEHGRINASPLFARILFADGCSVLAFGGIFLLTICGAKGTSVVLVLRSLGLLAGFAWEEVFDAAVDVAAKGSGYGHVAEGTLALVCVAAILPSYLTFKKAALQAEKDELEG